MLKAVLTLWLLGAITLSAQFAETPHPRLWLPSGGEAAIRKRIAEDPLGKSLNDSIIAQATVMLQSPTCRYEIPDGRRLLNQSRLALHQTMTCAWAFRMTGDKRFLTRAIAELEAACAMKDWNPSHFLDTAEMATAVAVGYDWLHAHLTPQQRQMCETAISDKALTPAKNAYKGSGWWNKASNNWSQVCGSGIALAAIAIQGEDKQLSADLIQRGIDLVGRCDHFYEPDGLYPEGPGYWHYGTNYHVMLIAACESLGQPIKVPAQLEKSGDSMMHLHGPTELAFNFADGKAHAQEKSPAQTWIARHYSNASQIRDLRRVLERTLEDEKKRRSQRSGPLHLIWLPAAGNSSQTVPLHAAFRGEQAAACFRTGWKSDASWLAIKGGTSAGGHSQMDVGSFCYDAHGTRWIHDLGSDNYNMPGYFGSGRFNYFRNQNRSHNTLEIGGKLQNAKAKPSPITQTSLTGNPASASFDLTPAYSQTAASVSRAVEFDAKTGIATLTDEIVKPSGDVVWRIMTDATATIDGNTVTLTKKNNSITLQQINGNGSWSLQSASPPLDIENPNKGFQRVALTVPKKDRITIKVAIRP